MASFVVVGQSQLAWRHVLRLRLYQLDGQHLLLKGATRLAKSHLEIQNNARVRLAKPICVFCFFASWSG